MSAPYPTIYSEILQENYVRIGKKGYRRYFEKIMRDETGSADRWKSLYRLCAHVCGNPAEVWHIRNYVVFEGEEYVDVV